MKKCDTPHARKIFYSPSTGIHRSNGQVGVWRRSAWNFVFGLYCNVCGFPDMTVVIRLRVVRVLCIQLPIVSQIICNGKQRIAT